MKKMIKKLIIIYLVIALLLLSSCEKNTNDPNAETRQELILATFYTDSITKNQVADFNKSNYKYYITIKEYWDFFDNLSFEENLNNYNEALVQFGIDVNTIGNKRKVPDIIILTSLDYNKFARQGFFTDLMSYFNKDINIYESALNTLKIDGSLYGIATNFHLQVFAMDKSMAGNDLSLESLIELQNVSDYSILGLSSKEAMLSYITSFYLDEFINWEMGKCDFNDPRFIAIMEMTKNCPDASDIDTVMNAIKEKLPIYMPILIDNPYRYQLWNNLFSRNLFCSGSR